MSNNNDQEGVIIEEKYFDHQGIQKIRRFLKGKFLGKGGFARCYEFTNQDTLEVYAAKIIPKQTLRRQRHRAKLISEIKIHRSLEHKHIVKFEHVFEDGDNVYILLELCTNQTLSELCKRRQRLTEFEAQYYIFQIVQALQYLHKNKVIHRDLKLGNLFLSANLEIKLGDFGLAARLEFETEKRYTVCGTPNYLAPEVLYNQVGHSYEVDVWSLGVILYAMLIGKPPFETPEVKLTYEKIKKGIYSFPEHIKVSDNAKNLIAKIFNLDPTKRPTLSQILAHPFLNNGVGIPKQMHISSLAMKPNKAFMEQAIECAQPVEQNLEQMQIEQSQIQANANNDVYIKKWVDYSSKYGVGYLLSNGNTGVYFNDNSKIIYSPKYDYFEYMEKKDQKQDVVYCYYLKSYPQALSKKITLLVHFKSYLENVKTNLPNYDPLAQQVPVSKRFAPMVYLKKVMKTKSAQLLRLSSKIVQVVFSDKTEIILSSESRMVTYVDSKGVREQYPINNALESTNHAMTKRLKYTKEILTHMLSMRSVNLQQQIDKI